MCFENSCTCVQMPHMTLYMYQLAGINISIICDYLSVVVGFSNFVKITKLHRYYRHLCIYDNSNLKGNGS